MPNIKIDVQIDGLDALKKFIEKNRKIVSELEVNIAEIEEAAAKVGININQLSAGTDN